MTKRVIIILAALLVVSWIGMVGGWKFYSKQLIKYQQSSVKEIQTIEDKYKGAINAVEDSVFKREVLITELKRDKSTLEEKLKISSKQATSLVQKHVFLKNKKDTIQVLANCDSLAATVQNLTESNSEYIELAAKTDSLFQEQILSKTNIINKKDSLYAEIKLSLEKKQEDYLKLYIKQAETKEKLKRRNRVLIAAVALIGGALLIK